jgi:hypothetical protein
MGLRAAYLISIFLPFLLLGPLLFALCRALDALAARARPRINGAAAAALCATIPPSRSPDQCPLPAPCMQSGRLTS